MAISGVMRPGHVCIRVMDLDKATDYYTDTLGLIRVDQDSVGRVYLKAWDERDAFSVILRECDCAGIDFMGFKVRSETDLDHFEKELVSHGLKVDRVPAGDLKDCGERVRFESPSGHLFELYAYKKQTGNLVGNENPDPWPQGLKGIHPHRFDHCLLMGSGATKTADIFTDILGFSLTERVLDPEGNRVVSFLSCSNKAHDIALAEGPEPARLHHVSFAVDSWEDVLRAADIISMHKVPIDVPPTRHAITRGTIIYFFDPSGNRNEVFAHDYTWYPDNPTITWTADQIGRGIFYHERQLREGFLEITT